ncbi:LuxR C-terminal-related transcriptional regulator [Psychromicrobium sp. YIM B11713]|uniref:LuxR C-terminal-related transcriptional regulator n=1 Tax=Psychromicrobium sp. YIM B11713 TaxID=3145233 RepID=UPI00374EA0FA
MLQAVLNPDHYGAVIVGPPRIGKSSLANIVAAELDSRHHRIQLRCAEDSRDTAYSCFKLFLARLPAELSNSISIIQGIHELIRLDAAGQEIVLVVDNAEHLDQQSAAVVANLLLSGIKIIATAGNWRDLPVGFQQMIRNHKIVDLELRGFSVAQSEKLLRAMLGGHISPTTLHTLHSLADGSPLLLQSLAAEQKRLGNLWQSPRYGVWILRGPISYAGSQWIEDFFRRQWKQQTPACREIIEVLALLRRCPLSRLAKRFSATALAGMQESGTVMIDDSIDRLVSLREPYFGEVVRSWLTLPRRQELYRVHGRYLMQEENGCSGQNLLDFAAAVLDAEQKLAAEHAIPAARVALERFDPEFALLALAGIEQREHGWLEAQELSAIAWMQLKFPDRAAKVFEAIPEKAWQSLDEETQARCVLTWAEALKWLPEHDEALKDLLSRTKSALIARSASGHLNRRTTELLELAELRYLHFIGRFHEALPRVEAGASDAAASEHHRLACEILRVEAYTAMGRELESAELSKGLFEEVHASGDRTLLIWWFDTHVISMLQWGDWQQIIKILEPALTRGPAQLKVFGPSIEAILGLANLFGEQAEKAIEQLLSACAQFDQKPTFGYTSMAEAALALVYATQGKRRQGRAHLQLSQQSKHERRPWFYESLTRNLELISARWLGRSEHEGDILRKAEADLAQGCTGLAAGVLFGALLIGGATPEECRLMIAVATHPQWRFTELAKAMAEGNLKRSAAQMLDAARLAEGLGLHLAVDRCAQQAETFALAAGDRFTAAQARRMLAKTGRPLSARAPVTDKELDVELAGRVAALTRRERQIVDLVRQKLSNKRIAARLGLSIRTVEGHLYQVYAKLGVSSRHDLAGI